MQEKDLPPVIMHDGATLLLYSPVDARHRPTGDSHHQVNGKVLGPASGLLLYRCDEVAYVMYYLLGYNALWGQDQSTLTRHATLEEAQAQAEFEYEGVSKTWEPVT